MKLLIIDNFNLIIPLVRENEELLQKYLSRVLHFILCGVGEKKYAIDKTNENAIFNDKSLVRHLLIAFVGLLIEASSDETIGKGLKYLDKLLEFIKSEK